MHSKKIEFIESRSKTGELSGFKISEFRDPLGFSEIRNPKILNPKLKITLDPDSTNSHLLWDGH